MMHVSSPTSDTYFNSFKTLIFNNFYVWQSLSVKREQSSRAGGLTWVGYKSTFAYLGLPLQRSPKQNKSSKVGIFTHENAPHDMSYFPVNLTSGRYAGMSCCQAPDARSRSVPLCSRWLRLFPYGNPFVYLFGLITETQQATCFPV